MKGPQIRKSDIFAFFGGGPALVARQFDPPITRSYVSNWKEIIPEVCAWRLLARHPALELYIVDPATGRTPAEDIAARQAEQAGR